MWGQGIVVSCWPLLFAKCTECQASRVLWYFSTLHFCLTFWSVRYCGRHFMFVHGAGRARNYILVRSAICLLWNPLDILQGYANGPFRWRKFCGLKSILSFSRVLVHLVRLILRLPLPLVLPLLLLVLIFLLLFFACHNEYLEGRFQFFLWRKQEELKRKLLRRTFSFGHNGHNLFPPAQLTSQPKHSYWF